MRLSVLVMMLFVPLGAYADTLVVGNKVDDTLSFLDLETGKEVARADADRWPHELTISPDGTTVVAVSYRDATDVGHYLDVFDVASAERRARISVAPNTAPHGIVWLPGTESVVTVTQGPSNVIRVDIASGTITDSLVTGEQDSHVVVLAPDAERLYVTNRGSQNISVVLVEPLTLVATYAGGEGAEGLAISPDGTTLWLTNRKAGTIWVIDAATGKVERTLDMGFDPVRLDLSPDGTVVAVLDYSKSRVVVLDAPTGTVTATVDLVAEAGVEEPAHIQYSPDGSVVFVSGQKAGVVVELDPDSWAVKRVMKAGAGADGQAYSKVDVNQ